MLLLKVRLHKEKKNSSYFSNYEVMYRSQIACVRDRFESIRTVNSFLTRFHPFSTAEPEERLEPADECVCVLPVAL